MTEEDDILRVILADPQDNAPRLVLADWLMERGDLESEIKADFIRDTTRFSSARGRKRKTIERQLRERARLIDIDWLAIVSKSKIEACVAKFRFRCPKAWEKLQTTGNVRVRHCGECRKSVHFCDSLADANNYATQGECVAISVGISRRSGDLYPYRLTLGRLMPDISLRELVDEFESDRTPG